MNSLGQLGPAIRAMLVLTVLLGLAYPLAMTGIAQVAFPGQADGSLVHVRRQAGRLLAVGQSFGTRTGYFWSRPSRRRRARLRPSGDAAPATWRPTTLTS